MVNGQGPKRTTRRIRRLVEKFSVVAALNGSVSATGDVEASARAERLVSPTGRPQFVPPVELASDAGIRRRDFEVESMGMKPPRTETRSPPRTSPGGTQGRWTAVVAGAGFEPTTFGL